MQSSLIDQIAASLEGYDPQALSVDAVAQFLSRLVDQAGGVRTTERVDLSAARGRILAENVISAMDVPAHNNSAMDGFAFAGNELGPAELCLNVTGSALAGSPWSGSFAAGECLRITTGAVMPAGLDTVVPLEFCTVEDSQVRFPASNLRRGDHLRLRGEDIAKGSVALAKGTRLGAAELGLLASLNQAQVSVFARLKVAYFSTGDEVLSLGEQAREGAVYDSNRYTVTAMLADMGCEVVELGVVPDEPAALRHAFASAAAQADTIITSGGVSVGEADHTKAMMRELGDVAFWRVAMRPGRPMAVGVLEGNVSKSLPSSHPTPSEAISNEKYAISHGDSIVYSYTNDSIESGRAAGRNCILFGLPGNPVAVMVTFLAFVRPALQQLMGAKATAAPLLQAKSQEAMRKKPGRTEYQRGIVSIGSDGSLQVRTTGQQGSGVLSSMVQANGLVVLPHEGGNVAIGDLVQVMMFEGVLS